MAFVMNNKEFVEKLRIALKEKSVYVKGGFGAPMTPRNKVRYRTQYPMNDRRAVDKADSETFGFDCVCLGKGILWGWDGNKNEIYGGARYGSNGVEDFASPFIEHYCSEWFDNKLTDISPVEGEWLLYKDGRHIGYAVKENGDTYVIESVLRPNEKDGDGVREVPYKREDWIGHGKCKYIEYIEEKKGPSTYFNGEFTCPLCGAKFHISITD